MSHPVSWAAKAATALLPLALGMAATPAVAAGATNVALGKPVTLVGSFFTGGWGSPEIADPGSVTDGKFFPTQHQWDRGPVWWDGILTQGHYLTIDLKGFFLIESFVVQADNNDRYLLSTWDASSGDWALAWDIPPLGNGGMFTRPDFTDNTARQPLPAPVLTNQLKFALNPAASDGWGSVSEIQAYGYPVGQFVTGGGFATVQGARLSFAGTVGTAEGKVVGQFRWTEHASSTAWRSIGFELLSFEGDAAASPTAPRNTAVFKGRFRNNRDDSQRTMWVRIADRGEGRKGAPDEIAFSADGVSWTPLTLGGGNFQVHDAR